MKNESVSLGARSPGDVTRKGSKRARGSADPPTPEPRLGARRSRAIGSAEVLEIVQLRLRVIGEPTRVQIMVLLDDRGSATVQELVDRLPGAATHQNVSRHLRMLYEAGMLRRRREGHSIRYELADWTSLWLLEQVAASVEEHLEAQRAVLARGAAGPA